jgi:hypothetical protein
MPLGARSMKYRETTPTLLNTWMPKQIPDATLAPTIIYPLFSFADQISSRPKF